MKEKKSENMGKLWATRIKVLIISGVLASIANMIYEWRTRAATIHMPWEVFPALLYMFIIIVISCLIHDLLAKVLPFQVPVILYVALITTILSFPFTGWFASTMAPMTLPLKVPTHSCCSMDSSSSTVKYAATILKQKLFSFVVA